MIRPSCLISTDMLFLRLLMSSYSIVLVLIIFTRCNNNVPR